MSALETEGTNASEAVSVSNVSLSPHEWARRNARVRRVKEGDLFFLFGGRNHILADYASPTGATQTRKGHVMHRDVIGKAFGTKVYTIGRKHWCYLLCPTPELVSSVLVNRTAIIQPSDASVMIASAMIRAGDTVVEAGTGSGMFTRALSQVVGPRGKVYTFEYNSERANQAKELFRKMKIEENIVSECRDVCSVGFPPALAGTVSAAFLDLPCPWLALGACAGALREGGVLVSYSPCIEQTSRVTQLLGDLGFGVAEGEEPTKSRKNRTVEYTVTYPESEIRGHTAFLTFAIKDVQRQKTASDHKSKDKNAQSSGTQREEEEEESQRKGGEEETAPPSKKAKLE